MSDIRIALTGFMGVGKSSIARHLASITGAPRSDLDAVIEDIKGRSIADYIDAEGVETFRAFETDVLKNELARNGSLILSLGGGTWTLPENRKLIKAAGFTTIWLESSFDHCWRNIRFSHKERPLARTKDEAMRLFEERQRDYCLADLHFIVRPELNSFDMASLIAEEVI